MSYVHPDKRVWVVHLETTWGQIYKRTVHLPQRISDPLQRELLERAAKLVRNLDRSCFTNVLSYHRADVECSYCGRRF